MPDRFVTCLILALGALASACGDGNRAAADAALASAQEEYDALQADAVEYVPEQAASVEDALAEARASLEDGDSTEALSELGTLTPSIGTLGDEIAFRKADLASQWDGLRASLPRAIEDIRHRIDELSNGEELPEGVTAEAVERARNGVETLSTTWTAATDAFRNGELSDALADATEVESQAAEMMTGLGIQQADDAP